MATLPDLPVDLSNGQVVLTATTAAEYWSLFYKGFTVEAVEESLSPQEKAARTRAARKAAEEQDQNPDANPDATSGDA